MFLFDYAVKINYVFKKFSHDYFGLGKSGGYIERKSPFYVSSTENNDPCHKLMTELMNF